MCGRFTIAPSVDLFERFRVEEGRFPFQPRYNVAPGQEVPVVFRDGVVRARYMRWGLIPSWARDGNIGRRLINARAETLAEKPAFRANLSHRRCLVPGTGFYEWKPAAGGKVPHLVRLLDGNLFAFAGLYDRWKDPAGAEAWTFTLVTTAPNSLVAPLHDRMPAILRITDEERWIAPGAPPDRDLPSLLGPYPAEAMEAYPVSDRVNNPAYDSPDLASPVRRDLSGWL